ncbi:hypothetical protein EDB81DRAFT_794834 [Dactylonectria macrodidyma]|uniref:Dicer-like protein 1 n=1 Tax=Dactylonectria macrodidyma TaxID=307937 RepID=A0A9P9EX88_9HYPO|nr:hypothetical protein EDB81DRAFT_794834 [Dactylonectria macrodidyma]
MDPEDLICLSPTKQAKPVATRDSLKRPIDLVETDSNEGEALNSGVVKPSPPEEVDRIIPLVQPENEHEPDDDDDDEDEDEDDPYRLTVNPERPKRVTEKKRLDTAAFQSWITKNQHEVTKKASQAAKNISNHSVAYLVKESEDRKIIATPREYQTELFERAKKKNTIVVLDTGSGKTLIAALLLRHTLEQELEDRVTRPQKKVAFFLVEKVALCFQQFAVLSCNLAYPVTKFYGDATLMMKTKEFWDTQIEENMIIVCTAQILLDCLSNGFIRMNQINLLIFDEAHHAKKNHPYARIIKDHYIRENEERPRVLGMTASPVDCQTRDVKVAAAELESMLCSEIATLSDEVVAHSDAHKQKVIETKETYARLENPNDSATELWHKVFEQISCNVQFRSSLELTKEASSSLGRWCADRYWKLLITDAETARLAARTDRDYMHDASSSQAEGAIEAIRTIQNIIDGHELGPIQPASTELSSKVKRLQEILKEAFVDQYTSGRRCIVFVEKRFTACLLSDLFSQPDMMIPGMTCSYMVGCQSATANYGNMSFRDQVVALQRFKRGETNCLFATPVAEEGIDIPECDLVIRFDLYNSAIQYLQSKGRARQANSRYIMMLEEGNMKQLRILHQATRDATALRRFCAALPADRKLQDQAVDAVAAAQYEQGGQKVYEVPTTGARLTYAHSLEVLAKFVSSIIPGDISSKPEYIVTTFGSKFIADVILPDSSPIKSMPGFPQRSKMLARSSAAFEMCVALIQKTYVNGHLQPVFAKKLPAMRNARLAVSSNKKADYNMLLKPKIWSELGTVISELYATALVLDNPDALGRQSRPMLLLSRQKIPQLPDVPLFLGNGQSSHAKLVAYEQPVKLTAENVQGLANFTLKVFEDVFSKEYDAKAQDIPYFLAPCVENHGEVLKNGHAQIDWPVVKTVTENEKLEWENASEDFFYDKFVTDPHSGSRKLVIHGINKSLRPTDPTPDNVPENKCRGYRMVEQNIKQYSNSLWLKSRQRAQWRDDQPVVNAELLSLRRNLLDEFQVDEDINNNCFIILEPLHVSPLPIDFVFMAMTFPAIIHRIDSSLITLDACSSLDLVIEPSLALEALTKDSDNTGDHDEEQINFQAGMGNNYERLEFLGDSFLKMATTISLFTLIPNSNEFEYHVERMLLVCNQNLFNHAVDRKLQEFVRSKSLDRRTWHPYLKLKKGKAPKTELRHNLADKSIADVCEALIGAAYVSTEGNFDMAVKAVTQMVKSKNHKMQAFDEYYKDYKVPSWQSGPSTAAQRLAVQQVADNCGYTFNSAPLLRSAFIHPSYPYETIPNYQRLEFLGDALLDMAIVDYLFKRYPAADPQWLTEHKMAMASNQFLGCVCVKLNLHKHLLVTTASLSGQISGYVAELEQAEEDAQNEASKEGTAVRCNFWLSASQPPKALPDIVEAFVGAMFVDSQYNYAVVIDFFQRFIQPYFEDMALYDTFAKKHPVTFLARKMQTELFCTQWRICTSNVPCAIDEGVRALTESDVVCALMIHGDVFTHATASSGRYAKISVAKKAIEKLKELGDGAKAAIKCDCQAPEPIDDAT